MTLPGSMTKFRISEISLVDRPAQEGARIAIMKAADVAKAIPGRMTKFRIDELSGVDRPAQAGALAVIIKSASPPAGDNAGLPEINSRAELEHHVGKFGQVAAADRPKMKRHLIDRAQAVGAVDVLPQGWADSAEPDEPEAGDTAESDQDVVKMARRGAEIRKADAGDRYGSPERSSGRAEGATATKAAFEAALTKLAKENAAAGHGTYAQCYSKLLMSSPEAQAALR